MASGFGPSCNLPGILIESGNLEAGVAQRYKLQL